MYEHLAKMKPDKEILHELYTNNERKWYYMALKKVRNEADAEDVVQTSMVRLAGSLGRYRDQPYENLEKLCNTIVINSAKDVLRDNKRRGKVIEIICNDLEEQGEEYPDALDRLIKKQNSELLRKALSRLDADDRYWIYLQYNLELKPKEIGEMQNLSSATVRKKIFNTRNKLAKILEEKEFEDLR